MYQRNILVDCDPCSVVYLMECKVCSVQYVGSAHMLFRNRLYNYKACNLRLFHCFTEERHHEFLDVNAFLLIGYLGNGRQC